MSDQNRGERNQNTETVVGPSDIPDIYVNATEVTVGVFDVTLLLSQEVPEVDKRGKVKIIERRPLARIRMSHAQAWTAAYLIVRLLSRLVRVHGRFLVPGELLDRLDLRDEYQELQELADAATNN